MSLDLPISELQSLYEEFADTMLNEFGCNCSIYYPLTKSECNNCTFVSLGNTSSSNVYNGVGPVSFTFGNCPVCEGRGYKEIESTPDIIKLRFYNNRKDWKNIGSSIVIPEAEGMIIGAIADMPKLLRMNKMQVETDINNYRTYFFVLASEPNKFGFGNAYFSCFIKRAS